MKSKRYAQIQTPLLYSSQVKKSFIEALVKAFPASGYDWVNTVSDKIYGTLNGRAVSLYTDEYKYLRDPRTIITSILGLPNRKLNGREKFTWSDIGLNFIGWERNVSTPKKIFNVFFGIFPLPIVLAYNVLKTAVTLVRNAVAIFTEFLPTFLSNLTQSAIDNLAYRGVDSDSVLTSKKESSPGLIALKGLKKVLDGWNFIGSAITSPANNIRKSWQEAKEAWGTNNIGTAKKRNILGATWAVTKMVLSGLITAAAIVVTFKFAVPYIAVHAPVWFAGVHTPAWLAGPLKAVTSFLSPVTTPISNFVSGAVNTLINTLGVTGTSVAVAAVAPPVMVGLGRANQAMTNKWRKPVQPTDGVELLGSDEQFYLVPKESTRELIDGMRNADDKGQQISTYKGNSLDGAPPQEVQEFSENKYATNFTRHAHKYSNRPVFSDSTVKTIFTPVVVEQEEPNKEQQNPTGSEDLGRSEEESLIRKPSKFGNKGNGTQE